MTVGDLVDDLLFLEQRRVCNQAHGQTTPSEGGQNFMEQQLRMGLVQNNTVSRAAEIVLFVPYF